MDSIKDLLLNILLIILPVLLYQSFWLEKSEQSPTRNRVVIFALSLISILLCMTFPVYIVPGSIYDLRLVPLLIGILYGGYRVGLGLLVVLFCYRYYVGGSGFLHTLVVYPFILAAAFYLASRYRSLSRTRRKWLAVLLAFCSSAFVDLLVLANTGTDDTALLTFFAAFAVLHAVAMLLAVHLAENIREKMIMRHEIQRAEKFHLLSELAASITHEIRNPMTVVRGFLQLMHDNQIPEEKKQMFLKLGIEELDRSETIISNYLSYARPQTTQIIPIDVSERITYATAVISSYATLRNVEIEQKTENNLLIMADPEKISQVLINMLKNGIEAMPSGGRLQIEASRKRDQVQIEISDTGLGMTKEQSARLGNAFFSTKATGTGLGLSVSYQIIESINGKIEVSSEENQGTQFTITIPACSM